MGASSWIAPNKPQRVAAFIKLTETLSLDKETERWKRLAIILPVVATVIAASISGAATYFSRSPAVRSSAASAPMQALSSAMGAAGSSSSSLQDLLARESQTSRPPLASSPIQDVIAHENTDFTKAFRIELGRTYLSRFRENDAQLYFSFTQGSDAHDLQVQLVMVAGDASVRPMLSIYDRSRTKLFTRWYENADGNTVKWTAPVTPGDYVVEVNPNGPGYSARFNLIPSAIDSITFDVDSLNDRSWNKQHLAPPATHRFVPVIFCQPGREDDLRHWMSCPALARLPAEIIPSMNNPAIEKPSQLR